MELEAEFEGSRQHHLASKADLKLMRKAQKADRIPTAVQSNVELVHSTTRSMLTKVAPS